MQNKKLIFGIIGGCLLLTLCACSIGGLLIFSAAREANREIQNTLLTPTPLITNTTTPTLFGATGITATPTSGSISNENLYTDSAKGFSFNYPRNWTKSEAGDSVAVSFVSPQAVRQGGIPASINVTTEDIPGSYSLQEYTKAAMEGLKDYIQDVSIKEEKDITINGKQGHMIVYTGTVSGKNFMWMQAWTVARNRAYIVTYSAEPNSFNTYKSAADASVQSLRVL